MSYPCSKVKEGNSREPFKLVKEDTMSNNDPIKKKKGTPTKVGRDCYGKICEERAVEDII